MALASATAWSVMRPSAGAEPTSEEVAVVLKVGLLDKIMHDAFYIHCSQFMFEQSARELEQSRSEVEEWM